MNAYVLGYVAYQMKAPHLTLHSINEMANKIRNPFHPDEKAWREWEYGFVDAFVDMHLKEEAT